MRLTATLLVLILFVFTFDGCKKSDLEREVHENLVIGGNDPPNYDGVTTIEVKNYVNRMYIDLVGREPTDTELDIDANSLIAAKFSIASRIAVIDVLLGSSEYYDRFYDIAGGKLLNGADSLDIKRPIQIYTFLKYQADTTGDSVLSYIFGLELDKLNALMNVTNDYKAGNITINQYYAILLNNNIYDDINMGSDNFVVSCFENLYNRYPTVAERDAGVNMVNGAATAVFLIDGNTKVDFITIVTTVDEFYEGLVLDSYKNLVLRDPTSFEMGSHTDSLVNGTYGYQDMQRKVLITEEYAGF